jgi:Holliday junction resolvase
MRAHRGRQEERERVDMIDRAIFACVRVAEARCTAAETCAQGAAAMGSA